jgi:hypothetical protein
LLAKNLPGLTNLNLSTVGYNLYNNPVSDMAMSFVSRYLSSLMWLHCDQCQLGRESLTSVGSGLQDLEGIIVRQSKDIGQGSAALGRLPKLKKIFLSNEVR